MPGGVTLISEGQREGTASGASFYEYDYRLVTTHGRGGVENNHSTDIEPLSPAPRV